MAMERIIAYFLEDFDFPTSTTLWTPGHGEMAVQFIGRKHPNGFQIIDASSGMAIIAARAPPA
jgi:hypothetical protein